MAKIRLEKFRKFVKDFTQRYHIIVNLHKRYLFLTYLIQRKPSQKIGKNTKFTKIEKQPKKSQNSYNFAYMLLRHELHPVQKDVLKTEK